MSLALGLAPLSAGGSEHELVARVRRGEDRAFEELYSRYRKRIGAYVLGMVGDHGRAEDITQEVFIAALRRMRDTERPIAFKPWIYEIAKNACIDHARRVRRGQEVSLDAEDEPSVALAPSLRGPALETAVEARQQLHDLRGAFGCLSENHHQILVMRELEGRSYEQIGERLGMSRGMVESTLFRARRKLGEEYEELVSGRRCEFVQSVVADPDRKSPGIRERRRLARHLAHCQPCRRHAHLAGFDDAILNPAGIAARIAALLPIPIIRLRGSWRARGAPRDAASASWWQSPAVARSVGTLARVADPAGGSVGFGRAAAAVAAVALSGAGGGLLVNAASSQSVTQVHGRAPAALVRPAVNRAGVPGSGAHVASGARIAPSTGASHRALPGVHAGALSSAGPATSGKPSTQGPAASGRSGTGPLHVPHPGVGAQLPGGHALPPAQTPAANLPSLPLRPAAANVPSLPKTDSLAAGVARLLTPPAATPKAAATRPAIEVVAGGASGSGRTGKA